MFTWILALGLIQGEAVVGDPHCAVVRSWLTRPETPDYISLRATGDSAWAGDYYADSMRGELTSVAPGPDARARPVQAQVFEVISASGPAAEEVRGHSGAAVVWWEWSFTCRRWYPTRSLKIEEEVFVVGSPREPEDWIDGMPTFDVERSDWIYAPETWANEPERGTTIRAMTVKEYAEMYPLLPTGNDPLMRRSLLVERLVEWGNREPLRWQLFPSRIILERAEAEASVP